MDVIKAGLNTVFIILALLLPGIILLIIHKKETFAKCLLVAGCCLLCLLSFTPFSNFLLWGLESRYPPLTDLKYFSETDFMVILTAWDSNVPEIPYTSNLGYRSAFRAFEANRIYKKLPHCKIIISGGENGVKLVRKFLLLLNVPAQDIIIDHSESTWKSAVNLKTVLENDQFILVTSATHLPRSMNSFIKEGLKPIPAPGDYLYGYYPKYNFPFPRYVTYYFPNTDALMRSSAALYEYLGIVWYYIAGKE